MAERDLNVRCDASLVRGPLLTDPRLPDGEKYGDITILKCWSCSLKDSVAGRGSTREVAAEESEAKAIALLRIECKKWKFTKEVLGIDPNEPMPDDFLPVESQEFVQSKA